MSLFGTYKRFEGLTPTLCYILLFYATVNFVTTKKRIYILVIAIAAGATASSIYGIAQHLGFDIFKWSSFEARRVFSTFGNPVFFSAYLVMTLPLAIALFFIKYTQQKEAVKRSFCITAGNKISPTSKKGDLHSLEKNVLTGNCHVLWIFFVLSAIIYTTFWLTNTRACFVALLGGMVPFLIVTFKKQTTERYKFAVLVIAFVLIGVFFNIRHETSVIKHFAADVNTTDNSSTSPFNKDEALPISEKSQILQRPWIAQKFSVAGSSFSRIFQYLAATRIIKDFPVLGIGPDTIGIVYQKYLAKVFSVQESDGCFHFPRQDRIHNDILDTTVTRGIFGLGTYIWLLAAFGIYIGKNYKRLNDQNKLLILGISAGILCYLIQNEFSFGNTPIVTLFWIMMGLCISIIKIHETEEGLGIKGNDLRSEDRGLIIEKSSERKKLKNGEHKRPQLPSSPTHRSSLYKYLKYLCCGTALIAIGFFTVFTLRFYRADAYFEYGRRILEYEKENLPSITEKGLFFIKHAIRLNPYETFYRDELCRTYIQNAVKTKDESWIQKAYIEANNSLKLIPQHFMGFFHLGMINQMLADHFNRNTVDQAIDYYKKAIDSDPFQAPFHSNLASLYLNKGKLDQAIGELYQAYLIRPYELNHVDRLTNAFLQKGDLDKALFFSKKTVELNPSEPGYYNNLGAILSKKGMQEEAINTFKKAVEINPKEPIYLDNLTKLYLSLGKYDELIPYYKKLIDLDPSVSDYHNNLGAIYKRKKQPEEAIQSYKKAAALKPDNPIYIHNLASAYIDLGKFTEAKDILQTFHKTYPDHNYINVHLLLANLYSNDGNWEKVAIECEHALKLGEKSPAVYRTLGIAYYNTHRYELAERVLNQILKLDPNDQVAKDLIAKISNMVN